MDGQAAVSDLLVTVPLHVLDSYRSNSYSTDCVHHEQTGSVITDRILRALDVLFNLVCILYCGCFDNCVGVLVMMVLVFIVFCIVCTVFLYCFVYVYLFLFVLSVLV